MSKKKVEVESNSNMFLLTDDQIQILKDYYGKQEAESWEVGELLDQLIDEAFSRLNQ